MCEAIKLKARYCSLVTLQSCLQISGSKYCCALQSIFCTTIFVNRILNLLFAISLWVKCLVKYLVTLQTPLWREKVLTFSSYKKIRFPQHIKSLKNNDKVIPLLWFAKKNRMISKELKHLIYLIRNPYFVKSIYFPQKHV